MKRLLLASTIILTMYSCCKAICDDQSLVVWGRNFTYTDVDTMFIIKYKTGTNFTERIDTVKRYMIAPTNAAQPVDFFETLDPVTDWKVVIPALNKEYFISNIETEKKRCNCEPGTYTTVKKFRFNNTEVEGSTVDLK